MKNPWMTYLEARYAMIMWLSKQGENDEKIAETLSMDEKQVRMIRIDPFNKRKTGK